MNKLDFEDFCHNETGSRISFHVWEISKRQEIQKYEYDASCEHIDKYKADTGFPEHKDHHAFASGR